MAARAPRLVLLTGASSGIGRAAALQFAARGERVLAVARSRERLELLAREARGPVTPLVADLSDGASARDLAAAVLGDHGLPDVIVANAGVGLDACISHTSDEALRTVFEVNVFGVVRTIRPFVADMVRRGSGRIVLVSSVVGLRGIPHYGAYSASKFALHGLADALRGEIWGSGVTVGLVCPGTTATDFETNRLREGPGQRRVRPRSLSAEQVGAAVVRMASSRRRRQVLPWESKLLVVADRIAPALVDRILARLLRSDAARS